MTYIDGFVAPVPTTDRETYRVFAERIAAIFKEWGALKVVECWGDDVPGGVLTSFPQAVDKRDNETVVFSWVIWPSKEVRDHAHSQMPHDARMAEEPMPFDGKRMIYGGFELLVDM